jgi:antitoxin (DNA-binding transcriptional repressor) of toxin-antitoxin stability system
MRTSSASGTESTSSLNDRRKIRFSLSRRDDSRFELNDRQPRHKGVADDFEHHPRISDRALQAGALFAAVMFSDGKGVFAMASVQPKRRTGSALLIDAASFVNHRRFTMTTATVRDLRTKFPALARKLADGEEIAITRRGKLVARLLPPSRRRTRRRADWSKSAAAALARTSKPLTAAQSAAILDYAKGSY